jgi:signal transduction histidine kinase
VPDTNNSGNRTSCTTGGAASALRISEATATPSAQKLAAPSTSTTAMAAARAGVEACGRLVQEQQLGIADHAQRQVQPALLAAGQDAHLLPCLSGQAGQVDDLVDVARRRVVAGVAGDRLTPSAPDFAALVAESTAVGSPAELVEVGDPALASPVVGRTAYRIVREALTNVRKHAPGAQATVRVEYDEAQIRVSIRNTPPNGQRGALAGTGSGLGLAHLRQRIELVHGTMQAGPEPDGGFRIEATLPAYVPTAEPAA